MLWIGSIAVLLVHAVPPPSGDWAFDVVRLRNGTEFRGLISGESDKEIRFTVVRRSPGRPTVCLPTTFRKSELETISRLSATERTELADRLRDIADSTKSGQTREQTLELVKEKGDWLRYQSGQFVLRSDASSEVVRRAAVRLEQIYAAYDRYFPVRRPGAPPTTITIFRNREEYDALLRAEKRTFANRAFYEPATRRIVAASDLDRFGADLEKVRLEHKQLRADLDKQEAALEKLYKAPELLRHVQPIRDTRRRIEQADRQNELAFDQSNRRLFATLYHEAFHAYADAFVYPAEETPLPRWLHEGLAQVFESAIVEGGELRVGHADAQRLAQAKSLARKKQLPSLQDLLQSGPKHFSTQLPTDAQEADAYYLAAWVYAHWLTFDRRVTGTRAFSDYLSDLKQGRDPIAAFAALAGQLPVQVEQSVEQFLLKLQPDGTVADLSTLPGGR
ncbi:MAG: DUF1570 domain-containing protein [Gemmataceae bacterium]|nr:DUF1570 domain-containing protein [Gemmataceae bacterium]